MHVTVGVVGGARPEAEALSLRGALRSDPELRPVEVRTPPTGTRPGQMGSLDEVVLAVVGAGGLGMTLVRALCGRLAGRRPDVRLVVTRNGSTVEIDVARARDVDQVAASYRQLEQPPDPGAGGGTGT